MRAVFDARIIIASNCVSKKPQTEWPMRLSAHIADETVELFARIPSISFERRARLAIGSGRMIDRMIPPASASGRLIEIIKMKKRPTEKQAREEDDQRSHGHALSANPWPCILSSSPAISTPRPYRTTWPDMTASELRDILIRDIIRAQGGSAVRWRRVVGHVKVYSRSTHAHCNWEARPSGSPHDVAIAEQAIDAIRPRHPYIDED